MQIDQFLDGNKAFVASLIQLQKRPKAKAKA